MKTETPKANQIIHDWYLVDATDQVLGRLATKIASIIRGKHKPYFSPHLDTGDYVIVVNAEKIKLTGTKELKKTYKRYSGYPGGLTEISFQRMKEKSPETIIEHAVKGMLPKNILGRSLLNKLKVYSGNEHPHQAQTPKPLSVS
jgi:large subunit ribosomal protein L13